MIICNTLIILLVLFGHKCFDKGLKSDLNNSKHYKGAGDETDTDASFDFILKLIKKQMLW